MKFYVLHKEQYFELDDEDSSFAKIISKEEAEEIKIHTTWDRLNPYEKDAIQRKIKEILKAKDNIRLEVVTIPTGNTWNYGQVRPVTVTFDEISVSDWIPLYGETTNEQG